MQEFLKQSWYIIVQSIVNYKIVTTQGSKNMVVSSTFK